MLQRTRILTSQPGTSIALLGGHYGWRAPTSSRRLASSSPSSVKTDPAGALEYCQKLVREKDYEGYVTSYLFPATVRPGILALRALNVELATIPDVARETSIARMRYQFWRDTLTKAVNGTAVEHPVALALTDSLRRSKLSTSWLMRLVQAREEDLEGRTMYTLTDLDKWAEANHSTLLYLQLEMLGIRDVHADHAASHLGKATGIVATLRGAAFHARHRRSYIPAEVAAKAGLSTEMLFRKGPEAPGVEDAFHTVASSAHAHLHSAISLQGKASKDALPVLMGAVPVSRYLDRLLHVQFNPFHPKLQKKDWSLPWHMYRTFSRKSLSGLV